MPPLLDFVASFGPPNPAPCPSSAGDLADDKAPSPNISSIPSPRSPLDDGVSLIASVSLSVIFELGEATLGADSGTRNLFLHFGQTTVRPAAFAGARILAPHLVQAIRAGSSLGAAGFAGPLPAAPPLAVVVAAAGTAGFAPCAPSNGARPNSSVSSLLAGDLAGARAGAEAGLFFTSSSGAKPIALSPACDLTAGACGTALTGFFVGSSSGASPKLLSIFDDGAPAVDVTLDVAGDAFAGRSSRGAKPILLSPPIVAPCASEDAPCDPEKRDGVE
jgi:hypothetical protein